MPDFGGRKYQNELSFLLIHEDQHLKKMYNIVENYLKNQLDNLGI